MRRRGAIFTLGSIVAVAACHHYESASDAPVDAGTTLPDASRVADATTPASDAVAEGSTADAGSPFDAPPQRFDDFERVDLPSGGPLGLTLSTGTNSSWDQNTCESGANRDACSNTTIRIEADATATPGAGTFLSTTLGSATRRIRFDFGMKLSAAAITATISQAQLVSIALANDRYIYLETRTGNLYLGDQFQEEGGSYSNEEVELGTLTTGWARYQLYVDLDGGTAQLARDGTVLTAKGLRPQITSAAPLSLRIGTTYTDGQTSFSQFIDNLGLSVF